MLRENKVKKQENLCSWRKGSLHARCSKTNPMFTTLLSKKVNCKEFNGVIANHKDKTEKRLGELGKRF